MLNLTAPSACTLKVSQEINWSSRQDLHPGTGAHPFSLSPVSVLLISPHFLPQTLYSVFLAAHTHAMWIQVEGSPPVSEAAVDTLPWILCLALLPSDGLLCPQLLEGKSKVLDHLSKGDHKEPYVPPVSQLEKAQFAVKPLCY